MKSRMTKAEYREILLQRIQNAKHEDFKIEKVSLSKNDPVLDLLRKYLKELG